MSSIATGPVDSESSPYPGRRVKHSRRGCVSCKDCRLRCTEERPACARCVDDHRTCEYQLLRLTWKDESFRRGVKHGRGRDVVSFVDPTPPSDLIDKAEWRPLQTKRGHFLNTFRADIEEPQMKRPHGFPRSIPRIQAATLLRGLSDADGMIFQYYQVQVCKTLTLVDGVSNCYRQIILPLSMSNKCVMSSLLALGALHLSLDQAYSDNYSVALYQKQRALQQLRHDVASFHESSTSHILVSMLMLCLFDITDNCQNSWSIHVLAAARLIKAGGAVALEPSLVSFVTKFFATRDIMGRSACGASSKFYKAGWDNPEEVDLSVGCSPKLLAIISSITDISCQNIDRAELDKGSATERTDAVEVQLDELIQLLPTTARTVPVSEALVLGQTSNIIHNAAKIYFYTALHSALPSTHIVRCLVTEQIQLIKRIPFLRSMHLWSIFVTALYALDDEERIFLLERFDKLEELPVTRSSTRAARVIVQTVWKNSDLQADMDPDQRLEAIESAWVRFVRPMSEGLSLA